MLQKALGLVLVLASIAGCIGCSNDEPLFVRGAASHESSGGLSGRSQRRRAHANLREALTL